MVIKPPAPRPDWWEPTDDEALAAHRAWLARLGGSALTPCPPDARAAHCCRRCQLWASRDGQQGRCTMPETAATVCCGPTVWHDGCEQWRPR